MTTPKDLIDSYNLLKHLSNNADKLKDILNSKDLSKCKLEVKYLSKNGESIKALEEIEDTYFKSLLSKNEQALKALSNNPELVDRIYNIYNKIKKYSSKYLMVYLLKNEIPKTSTLLSNFGVQLKYFEDQVTNPKRVAIIYFLLRNGHGYLNGFFKMLQILENVKSANSIKCQLDIMMSGNHPIIQKSKDCPELRLMKRHLMKYTFVGNSKHFFPSNRKMMEKATFYELCPDAKEFYNSEGFEIRADIRQTIDRFSEEYNLFKISHRQAEQIGQENESMRRKQVIDTCQSICSMYDKTDEEYQKYINIHTDIYNEDNKDFLNPEEYIERIDKRRIIINKNEDLKKLIPWEERRIFEKYLPYSRIKYRELKQIEKRKEEEIKANQNRIWHIIWEKYIKDDKEQTWKSNKDKVISSVKRIIGSEIKKCPTESKQKIMLFILDRVRMHFGLEIKYDAKEWEELTK